jgi:hypothetical protein
MEIRGRWELALQGFLALEIYLMFKKKNLENGITDFQQKELNVKVLRTKNLLKYLIFVDQVALTLTRPHMIKFISGEWK